MKRVLLTCLLLTACSKPQPAETPQQTVATPSPVVDSWPGKYEGDLMVRISGAPGAHKLILVAATADGCTGDIGLAGGELARDVSPDALQLVLHPDDKTACTIDVKKSGDSLAVNESGICTTYHGLSCSFNGSAKRLK